MTTEIFTIDREQVQKLNDLFYKFEASKAAKSVAVGGAVLGVGGAIVTAGTASADPTAEATIKAGVANAIAMIKAIDGIGLAAFGVALAPMGFMVTLRVLNMVLSRV
ncbi:MULTISPECIES: hypothetical protein [unclassified Microcoleus]|uniref:hypothetical protein n=1 Tax=unclassified Microcoleus TaxID=2642155 RepID=UPI002FD45316